MIQKNNKKESESNELERFSEKMRVLNIQNSHDLKVRVGFRDLNLLKRVLTRKALLFNERVSV